MKLYHCIVLVMLAVIMSGCATTLKPTAADPKTGRLPTTGRLRPDQIKVSKAISVQKFKNLAYLRTDGNSRKYNSFLMQSIQNLGFFSRIALKEDMESILLQSGKASQVSNISDLIGLSQAQRAYGDFLVIDFSTQFEGGFNFSAFLKAIDPKDGSVLFEAENKAFNWSGLDQPLFFPLLNAFQDWIENNRQK
jgi:hypothetical protein